MQPLRVNLFACRPPSPPRRDRQPCSHPRRSLKQGQHALVAERLLLKIGLKIGEEGLGEGEGDGRKGKGVGWTGEGVEMGRVEVADRLLSGRSAL